MDERKMIFSNLLNKVSMEGVCKAFNKAEADIKADFSYITQKIKNYCYKNNMPPIYCDSIEQAQKNRHAIFEVLPLIDLEKKPEFKIRHEAFSAGQVPGGAA